MVQMPEARIFDASTIEDEVAEIFKGSHDIAGAGAGASGVGRRALDPLHSSGVAPRSTDGGTVAQAHDPVNHPRHYTQHPSGVECIEITEWMNFNLGNVVKYVWRSDDKGQTIEDLRKAKWYLEREISRLERIAKP